MKKAARTRRFDKIGNGFLIPNKWRWRDAELLLYRPGYGMVSISFGDGSFDKYDSFLRIEEIDCFKMSRTFCKTPEGNKWTGITLWARSVNFMGYDKKDYLSGDIRDLVPLALKFIGWPVDPRRYFLIGKKGTFWGHPLPMHAPKEGK